MPTKKEDREAEESKETTREGCFGTFSDDDENCEDCDDLEDCTERTKEIEDGLSEDTDEEDDEVEEAEDDPDEELEDDESDSKDFDPASVDLSDSVTRIDTLADLSAGDLLSLAKHYKVKIPDDAKEDESEIMILIDDHFDNLPDEEPEEKEDPKPKKKVEESEAESDPDSDEDDEPEEEEPKPKPRKGRKPKVEPEEEVGEPDSEDAPEDTKKVEPKIASKDSAIVASDVVMEVMEIILDRSEAYLVAHGDLDHMVGVRDKLDSIIDANKALGGQVDSPDAEPEEDAPKPKPRKKKDPEPDPEPELELDDLEDEEPEEEPEYPEHPAYFAEIAKANKAKIFDKGDTVSMKIGPTVLAKLVLHKDEWQVLYSQGKLDKLPGTRSYKAHKGYPAIAADHAKASRLLDFHVKTRKRGMRRK